MTCFHPLQAHRDPAGGVIFSPRAGQDVGPPIQLPCGQCTGCRVARAREWSMRIMHEASLYEENCFVTLTYSDEFLPEHSSLCYPDFQRFMKRLRKFFAPRRIRFYMCGEYGGEFGRPHYHACLFNCRFGDSMPWKKGESGFTVHASPSLTRLWPFGLTSVGELTKESAGYTARYVLQKITGPMSKAHYEAIDPRTGEILGRVPEFNRMSTDPGIGASWYRRYSGSDVTPRDSLTVRGGAQLPVPKYYDRLRKRTDSDGLEQAKADREVRAAAHRFDNTPPRLAAKEVVESARLGFYKRSVE